MPPAVSVGHWLAWASSRAYWGLLAHTPYQTTIVYGCAGIRGVTSAPPHIRAALQRTFSTKHPYDVGQQAKQSTNPQTGDNLETLEPHSSASGGKQSPMGFQGAEGLSKISLVLPAAKASKKPDDWNDIFNRWYQQYQDFIGITDLKRAQDRVTELSEGLQGAQGERWRLQAEIEVLQSKLVDNHQRITKTEQYSQEHMQLFSEARDLSDTLRQMKVEFVEYERKERETFTHLSSAIRDCHERERMQAEQSKYWSIIASVVSAALASVITSINNWVRIREIKDHISASHLTLLEGYREMRSDILTILDHSSASSPSGTKDTENLARKMESLVERISTATNGLINKVQVTLGAPAGEEAAPAPAATTGAGAAAGGEVSYPRVAATMLVGAALGTLITAFFLGALGGSGGGVG